MKTRTLRTFFGFLILASLAACGGSGDPVLPSAAAPVQFADAAPATAPAAAPMPVASACSDPSCMSTDGLADQFRMASMERAAQADDATQPGYPNVPTNAMTLAEAHTPVALGTAALPRSN